MAVNRHFRVAARLSLRLQELGVSVPAVLRLANLPQNFFDQQRCLVNTQQLFALWHAIGSVATDPALGLQLGTETRLERFHPSGIAALCTETFGTAVSHMARYKQISCPEEMIQTFTDEEWRIRFHWLLAVDNEPAILTEYCFAWMQTIGSTGTGTDLHPLRIELTHQPAHLELLQQYFKCPIVSNAAHNVIVFRASDAQLPLVTRNTELLAMLAPQFDEQLKQATSGDNFVDLVRAVIRTRLTGARPCIDDTARAMHMSSRTLQRRLQSAGSSYQKVLDEARHQLARHYLISSALELNEAAYLLGYEDANSFVRAFRGWEGMPPGHWRETQRATRLAS